MTGESQSFWLLFVGECRDERFARGVTSNEALRVFLVEFSRYCRGKVVSKARAAAAGLLKKLLGPSDPTDLMELKLCGVRLFERKLRRCISTGKLNYCGILSAKI